MKNAVIILLVVLNNTLSICAQTNTNYLYGLFGKIQPSDNTIIYDKIDTSYHKNGNIFLITATDKNGVYKKEQHFWKNGNLASETIYKNGNYEGLSFELDSNGNLEGLNFCPNNNCLNFSFEDGRLWRIYGSDSTVRTRGLITLYHPNGLLAYKHNYNPSVDTAYYYYDTGVLKAKGLLSFNEVRVGEWKDYYPSSVIKSITSYTYSIYEHPGKRLEFDFERKKSGIWKLYSEKGKLLIQSVFENDSLKSGKDYRSKKEKLIYNWKDETYNEIF